MSDGTTAASNDALVREFLRAWERRDADHIVDCFTDDGVYHSVPLTPIVGKQAIREFVAGFVDVPPGQLVVRHQVASDTVVMNERTDHITLNGKPVTLPICGVFEIDGGRIKAWREYFDLGPARAAYAETTG
jgi:limonene-1,2-epoxide hydrolase